MIDAPPLSPYSAGERRAVGDREFRCIRVPAMAPAGRSSAATGREAARPLTHRKSLKHKRYAVRKA